ncbi:transcriptional regulator [Leptospira perolatii]|uniref:Transcriptional regulator n=1 Tax=Leptospira perolatii TaxID=2023191 RepID=A0A2M9ZQC6_9LEPT|nr:Crp/Fnr family transcriptional regulator [Leptospira perolatii]PJZ70452.1 transcriptional regulator [Leptospira perolatii]PJZ74288.1 transcriptional regulator [Leptospira perolatii]
MASALAYDPQINFSQFPLHRYRISADSRDIGSFLNKRTGPNRSRRFPKKSLLFTSEANADGFFWIKEGTVRTYIDSPSGLKQQTLKIYPKGTCVGIRDALFGESYNKNAECLEDTEVIFVGKEEAENLLNDDMFRDCIIKYITSESREAENRIYSMGTKQVHSKLAEILLSLQEAYGPEINLKFSREVMASIVGAKTETVVRALTDLKEKGWINVEKNIIRINDISALERLVEV